MSGASNWKSLLYQILGVVCIIVGLLEGLRTGYLQMIVSLICGITLIVGQHQNLYGKYFEYKNVLCLYLGILIFILGAVGYIFNIQYSVYCMVFGVVIALNSYFNY
jgi:predicted membrane channel-forming protein YqfA (hemolysin III family)